MIPTNLIKVPLVRQSTNYTCGVAALQSVLYYYGVEYREDKLSKQLKANQDSGTPYWEMTKLAQEKGFITEVGTEMTINDLIQSIDKGIPIIIAIQAWGKNEINWEDEWNSGHYVVVIGYDEANLYFMDPSTLGNYAFICKEEFLKRWHDIDQNGNKLFNFGIKIHHPSGPNYDPSNYFSIN